MTRGTGGSIAGVAEAVDAPRELNIFVKDPYRRMLFYPFGAAWRGYAVPDKQREQTLRAVMARYHATAKRLGPWFLCLNLGLLLAGVVAFPIARDPFLFMGSFLVPAILLIGCNWVLLRYQLGRLVTGLERVDCRDQAAARSRRILLILAAAAAAATLAVLRLEQQRIGAQATTAGAITYYAGVSGPLAASLLFGFLLFVFLSAWRNIVARLGDNRALLGVLIFGFFELCSVGYTAVIVLHPTPMVIVSRDGLFCRWSVRWSDVTEINLSGGGRLGDMHARLKLGSEPDYSLWSSNVKGCEITGLDEDYTTVYHAIRAAWLATRRAPDNSTSGDPALDQLKLGDARQRVVTLLGAPTLSARTGDGTVSLYYGDSVIPSAEAQNREVKAVYFDEDDHVARVALYGVKNGKIFDLIGKTDLVSGDEYPFLELIFFDKSRGR